MNKELWYERLGFKSNPFTIKTAYFNDEIIGYDNEIDTLIEKLSEHHMIFLEAEYGKGKSSIIQYLINEFKGQNKIIKVSRNRSDRALNYAKLARKTRGFFGKILNLKPKNVILIIDEVDKINQKDCDEIEKLFNNKILQSVLFVGVNFSKANLSNKIKKNMEKNLIVLKNLSPNEAIELVKSRIDTEEIISDEIIKVIFEKSNKNTRSFLENLERVFKGSFEQGKDKITLDDVKFI